MSNDNNPAGRLVSILRAAKAKGQDQNPARQVWADLLGVEQNNLPQLLVQLGHLIELPELIRKEISRHEDIDQAIFLKWLPKVQKSFSNINLTASFKNFMNPIDEAALDGLDFCSDLLSRRKPEKTLDQKELDSIYKDVSVLIDDILDSDTNQYLKQFMLEKLDDVIQAIRNYKIRGAKPIEKAVESTLGSIVTHKGIYEETKKSKNGSRFWKLLARVAIVVNIVAGSIQIGETAINLFSDDANQVVEAEILERENNTIEL